MMLKLVLIAAIVMVVLVSSVAAVSGKGGDGFKFFRLGGNSGTDPAADYLGTTDNQPLVIKTNGMEAIRVAADGNVGFTGDVGVTGSFLDSNNNAGTSGQVLSSSGTGTAWVDDANTDTTFDGTDFALSDQACAAGQLVTGVDATGNVTCTSPSSETFSPEAGGEGGSPFGLTCLGTQVATGLRVAISPDFGGSPSIRDVAIRCTEFRIGVFGGSSLTSANTFTLSAGGSSSLPSPTDLFCSPGEVMTGIQGSTKIAVVTRPTIENLSVQCKDILSGAVTIVGPAHAGITTAFTLPCPSGAVIGLKGRKGSIIDKIQASCF